MLGYKREDITSDSNILDILPFNDVISFIADIVIPLHDNKQPANSITVDYNFAKRDGSSMACRTAFTVHKSSH
eukprot:Pgem_evm1s15527